MREPLLSSSLTGVVGNETTDGGVPADGVDGFVSVDAGEGDDDNDDDDGDDDEDEDVGVAGGLPFSLGAVAVLVDTGDGASALVVTPPDALAFSEEAAAEGVEGAVPFSATTCLDLLACSFSAFSRRLLSLLFCFSFSFFLLLSPPSRSLRSRRCCASWRHRRRRPRPPYREHRFHRFFVLFIGALVLAFVLFGLLGGLRAHHIGGRVRNGAPPFRPTLPPLLGRRGRRREPLFGGRGAPAADMPLMPSSSNCLCITVATIEAQQAF